MTPALEGSKANPSAESVRKFMLANSDTANRLAAVTDEYLESNVIKIMELGEDAFVGGRYLSTCYEYIRRLKEKGESDD